jgi:hypothetical protein
MITLLMLLAACDDSTPEPTVAAEPAAPAHHEQPHDETAAPEALEPLRRALCPDRGEARL